jgi:hypothetical protein
MEAYNKIDAQQQHDLATAITTTMMEVAERYVDDDDASSLALVVDDMTKLLKMLSYIGQAEQVELIQADMWQLDCPKLELIRCIETIQEENYTL